MRRTETKIINRDVDLDITNLREFFFWLRLGTIFAR